MYSCLKVEHGADFSRGILPRPAISDKSYSFSARAFGIIGKLVALVLLFCTGCQAPKANRPLVAQTPNYLNPGDVIRITFPGAPELNQTQKIGTDGALSLPLIGTAQAAGKSPRQLQDELAGLYKPQLQDNEVLVSEETTAVPVAVSSGVRNPLKIGVVRRSTV